MTDLVFDYETVRAKVRGPRGQLFTAACFVETGAADAPFSINEWRRLYLEIADPTEYRTAMACIGNWEHWVAIRNSGAFKDQMDEWQYELEIKLRSAGVMNMISLAGSVSPGAAGAAKWLAEGGYVQDKRLNTKKGREREEKLKEDIANRVSKDAERLGLKVVNGTKE